MRFSFVHGLGNIFFIPNKRFWLPSCFSVVPPAVRCHFLGTRWVWTSVSLWQGLHFCSKVQKEKKMVKTIGSFCPGRLLLWDGRIQSLQGGGCWNSGNISRIMQHIKWDCLPVVEPWSFWLLHRRQDEDPQLETWTDGADGNDWSRPWKRMRKSERCAVNAGSVGSFAWCHYG